MKRAALEVALDFIGRAAPLLEDVGLKIEAIVSDPICGTALVSLSGDALPDDCRADEPMRFVKVTLFSDRVDHMIVNRVGRIEVDRTPGPSVREQAKRVFAMLAGQKEAA